MNSTYIKWIIFAVVATVAIGGVTVYQLKQAAANVTYEVLEIDNAPADIYARYELQKSTSTYSVVPSGNFNYVIITAGKYPNAGYWLDVTDVNPGKNSLTIKTVLNTPKPDEFVAQVITFPVIVVKTSQSGGKFIVYTDDKSVLEYK